MKYFTFPMETLNVTQSYLGTTSHYPHTTGTPKDYPIDCAGIDGGESAIFAPVDMRVTAIRGIGSSLTTNTIWLVTTEKVKTPTFTDYAFMTLHIGMIRIQLSPNGRWEVSSNKEKLFVMKEKMEQQPTIFIWL